jgi:hypothetical protein
MAAPGSATTATSAAILKTQYTQPKVYWLSYKNNPSLANIRKSEKFKGDSKVIAIQTETPQGGGNTIALAQANAIPSVYSKFILTRIDDFGIARVTGEAMKAAEDDEGSLIDLWKREMEGILHTVKRSLAIHMQRNGTGSRGQISAASNVATATITLAVVADITNFAVGMTVQATNGDGGALRSAGATAVITGINRTLGQLTIAGNWNASIAAIAASDFLNRNGDAQNGGSASMISGRGAWIPPADPGTTYVPTGYAVPASLFSNTRTSDVVRLAGLRLAASQMSMQEAIQEATAMVQVEGADNDLVCYMHPRDRANFAKELGAKVVYSREEKAISGSEARIGFSAIKLETDSGDVKIFSDLNVQRGTFYLGDPETECLESLGAAPMILDFDTLDFLRYTTDDSYEVRFGSYVNYSNAAPAFWVNAQGFGQ